MNASRLILQKKRGLSPAIAMGISGGKCLLMISAGLFGIFLPGCQSRPEGSGNGQPAPARPGVTGIVPEKSGYDYFESGQSLEKKGDYPAAIDAYTHAIALMPRATEAYLFRGLAFEESGHLDRAITDLATAVRLSPQDAFCHARLGIAHEANGELEAALEDYTASIQLEPTILRLIERGDLRRELGDLDGAMADYNRAIKQDPHDDFGYSERAKLEEIQGDLVHAREDYARHVELNPDKAMAYRGRAEFNFRTGDMVNALKDFEMARRHVDEHVVFEDIQIYLIGRRLGRPADNRALAVDIRQSKNEWSQSIARFLLGELTEEALLNAGLQGDAKTARDHSCDAYYYIGSVRLLNGNQAGARQMFEACRALNLKHSVEWEFSQVELTRPKT